MDSGQSFADSKLRLADAIDSLLNTAHLKGTKIGVQVAEVPGGQLVYQPVSYTHLTLPTKA